MVMMHAGCHDKLMAVVLCRSGWCAKMAVRLQIVPGGAVILKV